jgi:hypothetical protein
MASTLLFCGLIALGADGNPPATAADLAAYEQAKAIVGKSADAQVKLALWCESHGLPAERVKHLAMAVLSDPTNATARGLMGLVAFGGQWKRPEAVSAKVKADETLTAKLAEYNARRERTPETADAQWKLGLWCEENGLAAEAKAHFVSVTRLDPSREAAWKRLDCKKVGGRWVTEAQVAADKAEQEAQKSADKYWKPLLTKWRGWLSGKDSKKREESEQLLSGIVDPRAVPSIWEVFVAGRESSHSRAVALFGKIDAASSSLALGYLAVFDPSAEVRRAATETLKRRDPREFAAMLVGLLRKTVKYEVRPVGGPGSPGAIFVEGTRFNVQRVYAPPAIPNIPVSPSARLDFDGSGLPVITDVGPAQSISTDPFSQGQPVIHMSLAQFAAFNPTDPALSQAVADYRTNAPALWSRFFSSHPRNSMLRQNDPAAANRVQGVAIGRGSPTTTTSQTTTQIPIGQIVTEYQKTAVSAELQLERDVATIDAQNEQVKRLNLSVRGVLKEVAGKDLGETPEEWKKWWVDVQGYAYTPSAESPRPTLVENVPLDYTPQPVPVRQRTEITTSSKPGLQVVPYSSMPSCFGAGTLVRTMEGSRPIEAVKVGDRVLCQDVMSGALVYEPVTVVHHNPPSPTFNVRVNGDTIVSSPFHRFWVAGKGWVMARELKGGETLRMLDGLGTVTSVESGDVQLVFNLDVADHHDFFAGSAGALVHDNTLPDTRLTPFDATPELASLSTRK